MSLQRAFAFAGGLNLAGITMALKPGEATLLENFECLPLGGYRRHEGYERYDGHPEPSKASYKTLPFAFGSAPGFPVDAIVTGGTSGATGKVLRVTVTSGQFSTQNAVGTLVLQQVAGSFTQTEPLRVATVTVGVSTAEAEDASIFDDGYDDLVVMTADAARALINVVPGHGPILGAAIFQGKVHAFRNAADNQTACMYVSSPTGWQLKKSGLAPNGRYEFRVGNFYAGVATTYLYGVSGVHKGFEWTGTTWNDVTTGMTVDKPNHLEKHKNYLFYSFPGGSVQNSGVGTPLVWTVRTGAQEIGTGDEITGLKSTVGGTLVIYCATSTWLFTGSSAADWALTINASDSGAFPFSIQTVPGQTFALDERGIMPLQTTQAYGDFESAAVSQRVQPMIDSRRPVFVDSVVIKRKSQYRLWYGDGVAICVTLKGTSIVGYSVLRYLCTPTCAAQGLDADGHEMLVIGAADGFIYRTDVGMSLDGVAMDATILTAPDAINAPRQIKQFQNLLLQIATPRPIRLLAQVEYDYELSPADVSNYVTSDISYAAGAWDVGSWDQVSWDSGNERPGISYPSVRIDGAALTAAIALYHGAEIRPPFTIESGIFVFRNRGFRR